MKKKLLVFLSIFTLMVPFVAWAEDPEPGTGTEPGTTPTETTEPTTPPTEPSSTTSPDPETTITIKLSPSALELEVGDTKKLTVEVSGTDKTVTWKSSDETVATVDNGTVTAKKAGTAKITAEIDGESANCSVTVKAKQEEQKVSATLKSVKIAGATVEKVDENNYKVTVTDENKFSIIDDGQHVIISLSDEKAKYNMTSLDAKNQFKILVGDNTYTFKVIRPEANTYLSKLEIEGYAFDQTFNKDTLSYTVTVPYDVTEVKIKANAEDGNAKISTGTSFTKENLQIGGNTISIKVTNGSDSRTYKIFVTREEEEKKKETKTNSGSTSKTTSSSDDMEIPETTDPDSALNYIIITLGTLVLFSIGALGIFFYFKTSPTRMKKELLKKKKLDEEIKEESPIVEIEKPKQEIKNYDNDIEEL